MEPLDLNKWYDPAKDDFYLTVGEPKLHKFGWYPLLHINYWNRMQKKDGKPAFFCAVHLFWFVRFYFSTAKIDATRCFMYWNGELGGSELERDRNCFVANASKPGPRWPHLRTEHWAFRWKTSKPNGEVWSNMGGL